MEKLSYKLPSFEGPLDLLLYLLSKHKLDICDIPIAELLEQYMMHMEEMKQQVATLALLAAEKIVERSIAQVGQDQIVDEIIEQAGKRQWQN